MEGGGNHYDHLVNMRILNVGKQIKKYTHMNSEAHGESGYDLNLLTISY
jgi:hypothetical protein